MTLSQLSGAMGFCFQACQEGLAGRVQHQVLPILQAGATDPCTAATAPKDGFAPHGAGLRRRVSVLPPSISLRPHYSYGGERGDLNGQNI